jgi:glyoxylase-like metal-dependent hydrolase (beta-lactamase superfamily II)
MKAAWAIGLVPITVDRQTMTQHFLGEFGDFSVTVVVTGPPWHENCYIVRHVPSGDVVVVDPGGDSERILAALRTDGGTPREIWLTHGHPDHIGAVAALERALGIPTRAQAAESPVIAVAGPLSRSFTGEGLDDGPGDLHPFDGEPTLALGGAPVRVVHTPGHTPGGVCYDFGPFVLTGDTLFRQGVGRTDLPGGSEETLWASISRLLGLVADDALLCAGHGPAWPASEARRWWQMMA